jgi:hypothetical protein
LWGRGGREVKLHHPIQLSISGCPFPSEEAGCMIFNKVIRLEFVSASFAAEVVSAAIRSKIRYAVAKAEILLSIMKQRSASAPPVIQLW